MLKHKFIVPNDTALTRIDNFCLKLLPNLKRSHFFKLLRLNKILLNNKKAKLTDRVKPQDELVFLFDIQQFLVDQNKIISLKNVQDDLNIVFEDEHLIVVDKEVGVVCQADKKHSLFNLANTLLKHCGYLSYNPQSVEFYPRFANRLDRNTSGLVIGAKTAQALQELQAAFKQNLVVKNYLGVVFGNFKISGKKVAYWKKDAEKAVVSASLKPFIGAKKITTVFENTTYFAKNDFSLISIRLISGKTHQIRVHLNLFSTQLLGDKKYQLAIFSERNRVYKHQALQAIEISFEKLDIEKFPLLSKYQDFHFKSKLVPWFDHLLK